MDIEIEVDGKKYTVKIGKIKYKDKNEIMEKALRFKTNNTNPEKIEGEFNYSAFERELMKRSIKEISPAVKNIDEFIDNLDIESANEIVIEALKINPLGILATKTSGD